jgi:hypothetical protein
MVVESVISQPRGAQSTIMSGSIRRRPSPEAGGSTARSADE